MIEDIDQTIQHAEQQERTAYYAKLQSYRKLQKSLDRRIGDDLLNHYKVRNYAIEIRPSYESTHIQLYLHILPDYGYEETLKQAEEIDDLDVSWAYRNFIEDQIRHKFIDDLNIETGINIKVNTEEQFERLR